MQVVLKPSRRLYSSVSMVTRMWTARPGLHSRQGQGVPFFATTSRASLGPHQAFVQWTSGSFPGVKWPEREADHSFSYSAEVNGRGYTFTPTIRLHGVVLS